MTLDADEIHRTFAELGKTVADAFEEYEAKLDTANALVTCCCGNPVDSHGMGDGHSPVDQYHYAHMRMTERVEALKAQLASIKAEAVFLIERLDDFERGGTLRDYYGHVHPSRSRLLALVGGDT